MLRRLRSKDQSGKLADMALKDEVAGLDLISSLGSTDEGVREVASKAILEVSKKDLEKLVRLIGRWSGGRLYKMAAFMKWTEGLQSKNLDKLRSMIIQRLRSASLVDQLVNEQDEVNQKLSKLKEYFARNQVSEPVFQTLKGEYESNLGMARKRLLTQLLANAESLEGLMQQRLRIGNELSVLQTRANLGELGRKEIDAKRADLNKQLEEIQAKDRKLSEELSVMLMSSGPVSIYNANGEIHALASDFSADRERSAVELKARLLTQEDIRSGQLSDKKDELIAFVYNLTNKPVEGPGITSSDVTPEIAERVGSTVAQELEIDTEEALQVEKLRFFIEQMSWIPGKIRIAMIPTRGLTPTEKGFEVGPATTEIGRGEPAKAERIVDNLPRTVGVAPKPAEMPAKPIEPSYRQAEVHAESAQLSSEPEGLQGSRSMPPEKSGAEEKLMQQQFESIDQELESEIKSLQEVLDEEETKGTSDTPATMGIDDKVLNEIDKAAQKLREKMKR
jgi:hypothetical protein